MHLERVGFMYQGTIQGGGESNVDISYLAFVLTNRLLGHPSITIIPVGGGIR